MFGVTGIKLAAGAALVAVLALGAWRLEVVGNQRDEARAHLRDAISANASLIDERKRALAEAERNREISATALRETADLNSRVAAIRERLRNGAGCVIDPSDADALDSLFK